MSLTSDFLKAMEEEEKKKKKKYTGGDSFTREFLTELENEDIAPTTSTWFKKGNEDVSKTILGTLADVGEDFSAGVVGMGESIVDALAWLAPVVSQSQYIANGGGLGFNREQDNQFKQQNLASQNAMGEFIAKDLYDEKKVAQQLLSNLYSGANNINKLQGGMYLTEDELLAQQQGAQYVQGYMKNEMESDSVLGDKSDSLVQSAGQLAGTAALTAIGIPSDIVIGLTSFGGEAENALKQGATYSEAGLSAAISAGAEILSEKISGGIKFGGKTLDEAATKWLARNISNKAVRTGLKLGMDMLGEGGEELASGWASAIGQKLTYMSEKELTDLFTNEDQWESFIGGAVLGGGGSVTQAAKGKVTGVDSVTELTKNEQKVVDKVYKDRIAEAEKKGKVTQKQKAEIYDDVLNDLEKGYIKTETIEEVLGDRSAYDSLEKESKEFDTLYNTATGQLSKAQQDRLAELEAKNKENPYKDALEKSKEQYTKSVSDMVKGDRLSESYREKNRVYEDFRADIEKFKGTKHEDAARKTLESALKAGANNTNRVHDLVDMAAQISADTGRTFEFKSGEQIKNDFVERQTKVIAEMEKIPAAKRTAEQSKKLADLKDLLAKVQSGETVVNGDITADGIVLNLDSGKPLNRTVGHEVTHSLENAKSYKELKDSLYAYAKSKGIDIDNELNTRKLMYEGVADADPEAELVADLVGDFLFTDSEYVRKLSTENQNVFQKFWDKIKYLCKVATAGSQEARELARVEKAFADAYREGGKAQVGKQYSLSSMANTFFGDENMTAEQFAPTSSFDISGKDFRVQNPMQDNVAPAQETVSEMESVAEESSVTEDAPVDVVEDETTTEDIDPVQEIKTVKERLSAKLTNSQTELANVKQLREESSKSFDEKIAKAQALLDSKKNQDTKVANNIKRRIERLQRLKADVDAEYAKRINDIESKVTKTNTELEKDHTKQDNLERAYARIDAQLEREKAALDEEFNQRRESLKDKNTYISQKASELYNEIRNLKKGVRASDQLGYLLDTGHDWSSIRSALVNIKHTPGERVNLNSAIESIAREMLNEDYENSLYNLDDEYQAQVKQLEEDAEKSRDEARKAQQRVTRKNLHAGIVDKIKARFAENGFDFDSVLKKAKNLSTFATVDNTPQRVMEKSLGYKEGGVLADLTVNKVAQNETEGIKWLNSFTDRKSGLLANISKQYGIKPGSKASAAAQMYAEGFYVNDNNEIIQYGDAELAQDFKDAKVRENIKKLARDPRIRQIYDETLAAINESRVRNGYPEIPRLANYFLHFRAMDDTFSRLGLPFNPNDIKAKDLPTDLNGVTADLKPGQPYFASAMHRTGKRTSFDLLGGLEKYLTSAKNQIYHIDDIQTLRALRNYVADTYGQANGLEGLDALTEEEAQDRIEKVYNSHLSTFAKFLNEEANILAGKTALIDRGLEGIIGRRGITFLNTVNGQVGSNMVGFNLSSSLTNFLPVAQTFAKTNKADFVKAFGQTVANKVGSVFGRSDGFTENSPVVIRRKGADRFHRTPYQKVGDLGYVFMSAVDDISTELIARTKYNELTRNGMDSQQAHYETDKWVSRLMGDRSLGQMPQIYNSKMLGLITKFQLEVRNQLDSQFYDTIQETKASNEDIQNGLLRNAKTAAKVTSTFVQLAVVQHLFGMAFESVAGYNPAFDIIEVMIKALGWDDEEESEDTVLDNIEQGFLALLEDLPYASTFTGGRIPIESALPIEQFVKGVDQYGNEKSRLETLGEVAPYYLLPGGYGQIKKTAQGLGMFSDEHPIAGSYTDSGALRFPVEDTWQNRLQAGLFGQYASQNAGYYFDNDIAPLKDKQIQEFIDVDMPIRDYWDYRKGLSGLDTLSEKADYIDGLDLTDEQKNILINNIADRKEDIDMSDYGKYGSFEEFDFADKYPEKYSFFQENGITYQDYASADEEGKRAYTWASENPGKYEMSKAISDDFLTYWQYKTELGDLEGDKDANGKTISGSKKEKVIAYINDMDLDYGQKIILFKSEYNSDDTYNYDIIEYLNGRDDISYRQMETILKVLGFNVDAQGNITWD